MGPGDGAGPTRTSLPVLTTTTYTSATVDPVAVEPLA